jgi:hypothetical protein
MAEPNSPRKPDDEQSSRPLIVLLIMVALAIGGWFVIRKLSDMSRIQDCVMAGRNNCAPVDGP